jgi:hypothetical protein
LKKPRTGARLGKNVAGSAGAAKTAAVTRKARQEMRVRKIAHHVMVNGEKLTAREYCYICGKKLSDAASMARGIGSDCWQEVLAQIQMRRAAT